MGSCALLSLMMLTEVVCSAQCAVVMPKVVSAVAGSCAEIRCTFDNLVYSDIVGVMWLKREPGSGTPGYSIIYDSKDPSRQHYNYRGRAEFKANIAKKQRTFLLKDIRKSDEGTYEFTMEFASAWYTNRRRTQRSQVSVSVLVVCSAQCSVVMPKVVSAVLGSCVEIPCTFHNLVYYTKPTGRWIKLSPGPGNRGISTIYDSKYPHWKHSNYRGRAEFKGNIAHGQCSLLIKDIRKSDEGTYQLNLEFPLGVYTAKHHTDDAQVSLSISEKPEISENGELIARQTARLTCSIFHNCPEGNLQLKWINYNVSLPLPWSTHDGAEIINERFGSRRVSSLITFTPSSAHHGAVLGCTVLIGGIPTPSTETHILKIKYGLDIPIVNSSIAAVEGTSILLYCTAWGMPLASLRWVKNGEAISRSSTGELKQIFHNISSEDDGEYWCIAKNALGTTNRSTQISVQYKPKILAGPKCSSAENWANCTCRVRTNPPGNVTWGLNGRILTGNRSDVDVISWAVNSHLLESSLRLTYPTGTGNLISCAAANEHGDSVSKYQLHSKGIFSRTNVLIIGGGATGLVILIAVAVTLKIQRQKHGEAARVSEAHDDLVIYSTVQKALIAERADQYTEAGRGAAQSTKPAQSDEIVYAIVNISKFRKHEQYIQNEETCEYAAIKQN